jgi:hypothetical protein
MGAAIWRSGALWKWGGLLFIATGILGIPGFLDRPIIAIIGQFVGGVGLIAVGISLYQSSRRDTGIREES